MRKTIKNMVFFLFVVLVMGLSIWGPEALAVYKDQSVLDGIHAELVDTAGEGYRYVLTGNEKLYILSKALNSQKLPESGQSALTRNGTTDFDDGMDVNYEGLTGTYALVVNHREITQDAESDGEIYETLNHSLDTLKSLEILPESVKDVEEKAYDVVLYSAIDVLEPRNHVSVWKVSLSNSQINADKENRLIDAYIDAEDGKLYEFYARTPLVWEQIDPDEIIEKWSGYMGLGEPARYEVENPLMETTPYFRKYVFSGMGADRTIVTIGFYEGINEMFLRITK